MLNFSCQFWTDQSIPVQILHHYSLFRNIKLQIFKLSNVLCWNFAKFLMSFLKAQVNFSSNFASIFSAIKHSSFVFFSCNILNFGQKQLIKVQIFEIFEWSGKNLPNFSCHFPNYKPVFFQILHDSSVSWKITTLYFFRSKVIYFERKRPIKVQILETYECLDQNSPNSSHFWNNKLIFFPNFAYL